MWESHGAFHKSAMAVEHVHHLLGGHGKLMAHPKITKKPPPLFIQMDEYELEGSADAPPAVEEWLEVRRWIRYEECVEGQGERWSKPYVSTTSLYAMQDLRNELLTPSCVELDCTAANYKILMDNVVNLISKSYHLSEPQIYAIRQVLSKPHIPQCLNARRKEAEEKVRKREQSTQGKIKKVNFDDTATILAARWEKTAKKGGKDLDLFKNKIDQRFTKKCPPGTECANIFVADVKELTSNVACFIRLKEPFWCEGVTEVHANTKYLFVILSPKESNTRSIGHEMGRCMAALLCDDVFKNVVHLAKTVDDVVAGIDEFLEVVLLLPPYTWSAGMRIDPPAHRTDARKKDLASYKRRISSINMEDSDPDSEDEEDDDYIDPALTRTGKIFGGLIADVKRCIPWYLSDFKDGFHLQCLSSILFLYFAALTPIVAFGALLGESTHDNIASMECIIAGAVCGVLYHLFAGQALIVLGPTGHMLVLEVIVYNFSVEHDLNFLSFRFWIGLWIAVFLLMLVMLDLSALVSYITRFTEEAFAFLISVMFIYDAIHKVIEIKDHNANSGKLFQHCHCTPQTNHTSTGISANIKAADIIDTMVSNVTNFALTHLHDGNMSFGKHNKHISDKECLRNNGTLTDCQMVERGDEIFPFSIIWFLLTFIIALTLNWLRSSSFPRVIRNRASDFCVFIAIAIVTLLDFLVGAETPKLVTPTKFEPSNPNRGWVVEPLANLPYWAPLAAAIPAILATILIFMDQQITAVIVNRKGNKLLKGVGYHLDLLIVAILVVICSTFGLPWYVASTVVAITHVTSLRKISEYTPPGEAPQFIGIREQRLTGIVAHLLIGLSVLFTPLLMVVPMPVLYGVFLYMGVNSLTGLSIMTRIRLMITPPKYHPDLKHIRMIALRRINIFTAIQIVCLILLLIIKKVEEISIGFSLMVAGLALIRILFLEKFFTQTELKKLDNILPNRIKPNDESDNEREKASTSNSEQQNQPLVKQPNGTPCHPSNGHPDTTEYQIGKDF